MEKPIAGGSDIPALSDAYQNARKSYALSSGLLIAWELIGIELTETPIENFHVVLKSPQAVPYALLVLIIYFSLRFSIEWYQADESRRFLVASRIDFALAHGIGFLALSIYTIQTLLSLQIANMVSPLHVSSGLLGMISVLGCRMIIDLLWKSERALLDWVIFVAIALGLLYVIVITVLRVRGEPWVLLSTAFGLVLGIAVEGVIRMAKRRMGFS